MTGTCPTNSARIVLESGCVLSSNSRCVVLALPSSTANEPNKDTTTRDDHDANNNGNDVIGNNTGSGWIALSSAILNGGLFRLDDAGYAPLHVLNATVPADYDGLQPNPEILTRRLAQAQGLDPESTIGLLTAASVKTLRTASRRCPAVNNNGNGGFDDDEIVEDVVVDAIVTAGLSNARAAGADADYFLFCDNDNTDDDENDIKHAHTCTDQKKNDTTKNRTGNLKQAKSPLPPPGTINTIVVTNACLDTRALVEAYSVAVEAKCNACIELGVVCSKSGNELAQGTGTDVLVFICAAASTNSTTTTTNNERRQRQRQQVQHAGKHTLFAEMVGQAVREATRESILTNIHYMHGNFYPNYLAHQWAMRIANTLRGARPCIPAKPEMPVPWAPASVLVVGCTAVVLTFMAPSRLFCHSVRVIMAVIAWDRYLGELPLVIHPVCLVGRWISFILSKCPGRIFSIPVLGFTAGCAMLISTVLVSLSTFWVMQNAANSLAVWLVQATAASGWPESVEFVVTTMCNFLVFNFEVVVVKSATSLQLLCTLALQMAKFLERRQISEARAQLSWLCSRDPSNLNASELAAGTLESLAENLSDGFVAPLCFFIAFGPLGALGYRVVNTLDSRIGYHGKYEWFGKPSARLDDLLNLAPARITALLLCFAAVNVPGCRARDGFSVAWRDCSQCESPNAGWPMAAMAGLLGVRLEKKGAYSLGRVGCGHGITATGVSRPLPTPQNIRAGHQVAQLAGGMATVLAVVLCSYFHS